MANKLDIQDLLLNDTATVRFLFPEGEPKQLKAIYTGGFSASGSNEWDAVFDFSAQQMLSNVANFAGPIWDKVKESLGMAKSGGKATGQVQVKTKEQTWLSWKGSAKPTFTFNVLFIAIEETDDVVADVNRLMEGVYPTYESARFIAPLNYSTGGKSGTMTVHLGKWFRASGLVFKEVGGFSYSKETIKSGKPLYAEGSVTLEPYRAIDISEYKAYYL